MTKSHFKQTDCGSSRKAALVKSPEEFSAIKVHLSMLSLDIFKVLVSLWSKVSKKPVLSNLS